MENLHIPLNTVEGLDTARGLRLFEGDVAAYLRTLRSYSAQTPAILEAIKDPAPGNLGDYMVNVHGIKGSSYTICAAGVGKQAEDLERAARAEDIAYVRAQNGEFIRAAEALLSELRKLLEELSPRDGRPLKPAPERELLEAVFRASKAYDMEALEEALAKLEEFRYEQGGELVTWLCEQGARSEFGKIIERLA